MLKLTLLVLHVLCFSLYYNVMNVIYFYVFISNLVIDFIIKLIRLIMRLSIICWKKLLHLALTIYMSQILLYAEKNNYKPIQFKTKMQQIKEFSKCPFYHNKKCPAPFNSSWSTSLYSVKSRCWQIKTSLYENSKKF